METTHDFLHIKQDVLDALKKGKPVVALESTIISHGMPYPQNVEMAKRVEEIVREEGAVPATIAIIDGEIKIGLTEEDLETLAKAPSVMKVSRRDVSYVLAQKKIGATTVASTMICASLAGIKFFVTGGIGGVHKGFEDTMDISADLEELAQTDVVVICAGAKAILDLPRTMEYLETKGVPVVGYQTDMLPAFYSRTSNIRVPIRANDVVEIADMIHVKDALKLKGGMLIANPVPEKDSLDNTYMNDIINQAVKGLEENHIIGKDITPYLLKTIVEKTDGKSLKTNIALVYHNAKIGAKLAVAYGLKKS